MEIMDQRNAIHYQWGYQCDGWHYLQNDELSIIKERMPAGTREVKHYHKKSTQFFYILSGKAYFEIEAEIFTLEAHQGIEIKAGSIHHIRNQGPGDLEFLVISHPKSHGDRIIIE